MTLNTDVNRRLFALWKELAPPSRDLLVPLVQDHRQPGSLLFVGLNPSFSPRVMDRLLPDEQRGTIDVESYFRWREREQFSKEISIEIDRRSMREYSYFRRCREMATQIEIHWEHLDLLFWRQTSQSRVQDIVFDDIRERKLNEFGRAQLNLSFELLEAALPRCVVVINALASGIYRDHRDHLAFQKERGCYTDFIGGRETPVFLSGMLTQQRALDRYSYERLVWHVAKEFGAEFRGHVESA